MGLGFSITLLGISYYPCLTLNYLFDIFRPSLKTAQFGLNCQPVF